MQHFGVWGLPVVAVQVLVEMKKAGVHLWCALRRVAQLARRYIFTRRSQEFLPHENDSR